MQEEVENRTVNLAISTTKLTGRTIIAGIRKYLQHREKVKMKKARDPAVHGKQSVKQLLGQNQGATNVEIDKESIRDFEKLAKKYGVDFAVRKDKSVDPPRFLVFVRSKDADALDEKFDLELPESDDYVTIAGFILHFYQKFPKLNETIVIDKYSFKIVKVTATKIELVRMKVVS